LGGCKKYLKKLKQERKKNVWNLGTKRQREVTPYPGDATARDKTRSLRGGKTILAKRGVWRKDHEENQSPIEVGCGEGW